MNALGSLLVLLLFTSTAGAVPFWGDKASRDAGTDPQRLKPGQFIWDAEAAPEFMALVQPLLAPGASLVVTDLPVLEQETTGRALTVVTADPPTPG